VRQSVKIRTPKISSRIHKPQKKKEEKMDLVTVLHGFGNNKKKRTLWKPTIDNQRSPEKCYQVPAAILLVPMVVPLKPDIRR
jgi:hypothetical protein